MTNESNNEKVYNGWAKTQSKLFRYLFLLSIAVSVVDLLLGDFFAQVLPFMYIPGAILDAILTVLYSAVLLRIGSEDKQYRTAGYAILIAGALQFLATDFTGDGSKYLLLLSIITSVIRFVGEYNEMTAHDNLLINTDVNLSDRWTVLRKWYMIAFFVYSMSIMLLMIIPTVGVVASFVGSLGMLAINILKIWYLYRSHQAFLAQ